jgi:tRNA pseudouridine55 synthase
VVKADEWLQAARTDGAMALIDKAEQWTSFDVVAVLRNRSKVKKVGHAGTLDPLATGLLVVCFGKATKRIAEVQDADKEYLTTIRLGATTPTDDAAEAEENVTAVDHLTHRAIEEAVDTFRGTIRQLPPAFSAIRHGGRRQYDLAREGKTFEERWREVTVHEIGIENVAIPMVTLRIRCSKGTYVRSIARDLGAALGVGGYCRSLRRLAIGSLRVEDAITVDTFKQLAAAPANA